ncbi:MAG: sulfatase-like hydrolase/transferase [Acidimicrobiaceae bacterium]|jgi:arylsulfatase A-like enzyme|nr:sulfatase-like hydrolase/transferase [Acidimicrobiaceae bacterium]MBT5581274.1 sulfatase-like hydrolase/transferase [Acidimicrobiaceae bacterium]MBT5849117.1 sulfatase-like hydrolase/transferase [Acidimicrobiaceae bacterium]
MTKRPNILFIITDQQRAADTGFMGNQVVRTPHLDALAARGTVFDNAWVANPMCMPNRSTIMTGRMPSVHGVIFNDRSLELGAATHVRQFREAGYRTALFGKSHLQHGLSRNSVTEFDLAATVDHGYGLGWDELENYELYENGPPEFPDDFYGFGHVELSIDHGARVSGHHLQWALGKGGRYEDLMVPITEESPCRRRSDRWWQVYQPPYDEDLHSTNFVTERTIDFINDAVSAGEPFYTWASFPDPHHPMTPPGRWFDRHDPADMELPVSINDPLEHAPEYLRRFQELGLATATQRSWVAPAGATDHELVKECIAATYGAIEFIDDGVGRILAAIEANGELDDTIVVFTADHGDMMGEHGLMLKGFMPFRGTQQVPLVIVDPSRSPGRSGSLSGSIDLAPTLMDICDVQPHDGIQGQSLAPVLDDPSASVRDHVLIEQDRRAAVTRGRIPHRIRTLISRDGSEYTRWNTGESMLYDLSEDPHELEELSHADNTRKAVQDDRLVGALMEAADDSRGAPVVRRAIHG